MLKFVEASLASRKKASVIPLLTALILNFNREADGGTLDAYI